MRYMKVVWRHSCVEEPILLYSEIGDDNFEVRKVDLFADGRQQLAGPDQQKGAGTFLGIVEVPSLDAIAEQDEFTPFAISQDEFESVWEQAVRYCDLAPES